MSLSDAQKARAEATFKRKEAQALDGATAWAEYEAESRAIITKSCRSLSKVRDRGARSGADVKLTGPLVSSATLCNSETIRPMRS